MASIAVIELRWRQWGSLTSTCHLICKSNYYVEYVAIVIIVIDNDRFEILSKFFFELVFEHFSETREDGQK